MIRLRLEFRNAKVREVFEVLRKICREFKVWRYDGIVFAVLNVKSVSGLCELEKNLRSKGTEFSYSRIDFELHWWERWRLNLIR